MENIMSTTYTAPLKDIKFVIDELANYKIIASLPGYEDASPDLVYAILEESAKFSSRVLAPLNLSGDHEGAKWHDGNVTLPKGFKEAYQQFVEGGWNGIGSEVEYGGQGMPRIVYAAVQEMWKSANLAFSHGPLLTSGAVEALTLKGSDELKAKFLPNMINGKWTGTMNLTEPQAGSDLALVRTKAVKQADGSYKITGQKIFITYGEHDLTENIVHLVLARTPDAPEGVKGISMFVVPKFMVNEDGSIGARNDMRCVSIEHKLGVRASPTCILAYGDNGGATGYLVGEENRGLEYMFIMMNAARYAVGLEGLGVAERAYQKAVAYAKERVQGREIAPNAPKHSVTIIHHPDVRRMLMHMRSLIEAMRSLAYVVGASQDFAEKHPDEEERKRNAAFVDLMMPVVKAWSTENAIQIAQLGIQVHGGMGYIEETGAAQFMRDARITTIYEGTTGIQSNDLMFRKIIREGGKTLREVIGTMSQFEAEIAAQPGADFAAIREQYAKGMKALTQASMSIATNAMQDIRSVAAGAYPFLELFGIVSGGWQLTRGAIVAQAKIHAGDSDPFYRAKIVTARFYADHIMSKALGLSHAVANGGAGVLGLAEEQF
jgi:alkylation response protein AidB-like acyl-CoA dehydrogenase